MTFLNEMDMEDHRITRGTIIALLRAAATAPQWIRVSRLWNTDVRKFWDVKIQCVGGRALVAWLLRSVR